MFFFSTASEEVPVTEKGKFKDIANPATVNGLSYGLIAGIVIDIGIVLLVVVLGAVFLYAVSITY